jgi:hypothetical protein
MAGAIADGEKNKRGRPRPGIGRVVGVRLYPDTEDTLKAWIAGQPKPRPSKPDAISRTLRLALRSPGRE